MIRWNVLVGCDMAMVAVNKQPASNLYPALGRSLCESKVQFVAENKYE